MQKLKGLWIPAGILLNRELSDKEKIILAIIMYLSEETKSCFASNKYIANIVKVTADRVSKIISSLKKLYKSKTNANSQADTTKPLKEYSFLSNPSLALSTISMI